MTTINETSAGHVIDDSRTLLARRRSKPQAKVHLSTSGGLPAESPDGSGNGQSIIVSQIAVAVPDPILAIRELQAHRIATVKMQLRIDNQCAAIVRRAMGWQLDMPEAERTKINERAAELVEAIQDTSVIEANERVIADAVRPFVLAARESRRPFDDYRANLEKQMRKLARLLPVWPWAEAVNGFGKLGLAIIVGECGNLSNYSNPGKLWKRMGLAVINGKSQRKTTDAEQAIEQGYNPRRRSSSWTIADSLLRQPGPYQDLYRARRDYECQQHPEFDKGINAKTGRRKVTLHCDRRSRRYAEKRLIRDLWRAWRDAKVKRESNDGEP